MEIKGRIIAILPMQSGQGKNGQWRKLEFVIETEGQYPRKVCFSIWGDKIDQFQIKKDQTVSVSFELESREYNQRWYTDARAWKVEQAEENGKSVDKSSESSATEPDWLTNSTNEPEIEDFPF